eukprot:m.262924 g.262924  ORF g.262924 m.262924 type:complete len:74 (-) comp11049_c5_seq4:820-1041(-)
MFSSANASLVWDSYQCLALDSFLLCVGLVPWACNGRFVSRSLRGLLCFYFISALFLFLPVHVDERAADEVRMR